jgi:hypothetical protein
MELIDHTVSWCRGEVFEGNMAFLYGTVVLVISVAFWKYVRTPNARAMIVPLIVIALLFIAGGLYLNLQNQNRIVDYRQAYTENAEQFIQSEKARTEEFIRWYPVTKYSMAGLIIVGLLLLLCLGSPNWKGVGIGLILLGSSIIFLDHFSEERAVMYHLKIIESSQQAEQQ